MQNRHSIIGFLIVPLIFLSASGQLAEGPLATSPSAVTSRFHPVALDDFYQRLFAGYRPTESWAMVPRGVTNLGGVPFRMFGKIDLTGLGRARVGEFQPARVGEIPVGQRAARVHLIHGASYDAPDDTPIACLLLHFKNGEDRKLFIRYGIHVRNWYAERSERNSDLQDPRSLVVWNGNARADGAGTPTRLFKTTFDNPRAGDEIRGIELLSLFARANSVILAVTLERSDTATAGAAAVQPTEDDIDLRRELLVRVLDAKTDRAVSNVVASLQVTEGDRSYRFGNYNSDAHGQILLDYPPGKFQKLTLALSNPAYVPLVFTASNDEGIYAAELPVRLIGSTVPRPGE